MSEQEPTVRNTSIDRVEDQLADGVSSAAEQAVAASRRMAIDALNSVAGAVDELRQHALPAMDRVGERVASATHDGVAAVVDGSHRANVAMRRAGDDAVRFIQHEPVKSVVFAALGGAAVMAVLSLVAGRRSDGR